MCGICFVCQLGTENSQHLEGEDGSPLTHRQASQISQYVLFKDSLLKQRGPDASSCLEMVLNGNLSGFMQGCVLHLRGSLTQQPVKNSKGSALLWNGEIFDGVEVREEENDTQVLFDLLDSCSSQESILQVFQRIDGPWAFIYWQADAKTLWFGRDMFGRRSLLWHLPENSEDNFVLSSVAIGEKVYKEIPSVGIFSMDFSQTKEQGDEMPPSMSTLPPIVLHPWLDCRWPGTSISVRKTPTEYLMESLYPCSKTCGVCVSVSETGLDRWIPTSCNSLTLPDGIQGKDSVSQNEVLSSIPTEAYTDNTCSGSASGTLQTNMPKCENAPLVVENDSGEVLSKIWEERKDFHLLAQKCTEILQDAVNTRVKKLVHRDLPSSESISEPSQKSSSRVAVLFSGGLDSTLLAALVDRCLPEGETIDLLNVAFEQPAPSVPRQNAGKHKRLQKHNRKARQVKSGENSGETDCGTADSSLSNKVEEAVFISELEACSKNSSKVNDHSAECSSISSADAAVPGCTANSTPSCSVDQSLSFSTTDSEQTPSIRLPASSHVSENSAVIPDSSAPSDKAEAENPSFGSSKSHSIKAPTEAVLDSNNIDPPAFDPYNVPDRQTGRIALSELNPRRHWNFVEINVTQAQLLSFRQNRISRLIYPLKTVLDDSIGCAVWFAARGQGIVEARDSRDGIQKKQDFHSEAQVLLCGMAADELFAGYSRHRVTFNKEGWSGLEKEIQEELWRISSRNLGRDDRIIADHGKEARFPYLDEKFVHLVSQIPLQKRVDLSYPRGIGEKLLLRLCALNLGLVKTACQAKRAIQFGSKIAKLDNRKEKGSDVCDRLS